MKHSLGFPRSRTLRDFSTGLIFSFHAKEADSLISVLPKDAQPPFQ